MRTIVFVDGYNLYYGLLRKSPWKWLDLVALFRDHALEPKTELIEMRFYTAPVKGKLCDDMDSPQRQRTYWQALRKHSGDAIKIIEGKFAMATPFLRLAAAAGNLPIKTNVQVFTLAEKKSDVNLAVDMMDVACNASAEQIVLCSNDSDFESALAMIKRRYPTIKLGLVAPIAKEEHRYLSSDLRTHCDWAKPLSRVHLQHSQLPERIPGTALKRPASWR